MAVQDYQNVESGCKCYGTQESDTDVKGNGSLLTPVEHAEGKQVWKTDDTLELEIAGEHSHTGDRRHRRKETRWIQVSRKQGVLECNDEVQVAVISILVIECVVIGGRWSLTCL
ncbi:hypothetical protein DPX16_16767 [Anabarilius grahami]|uniref:Uncharacterized protein n=1 Tax=Anabarilius grahami TaxID=495550 RepID=A0A3N0YSH2_ANAGA|nr:hypothetical protein DPX16_16767 [Anabarilius grahami]